MPELRRQNAAVVVSAGGLEYRGTPAEPITGVAEEHIRRVDISGGGVPALTPKYAYPSLREVRYLALHLRTEMLQSRCCRLMTTATPEH